MCRYPEPDEFKVDATYTCWVSHMKVGIHSKYTEHIHKFKYRQGNRPAGEHLRVKPSITDKPILANHHRQRTVKLSAVCREIMQINVKLGKCFNIFKDSAE